MELISKLKCALTSKQSIENYYASLSREELIKREKDLATNYIITNGSWMLSLALFYILLLKDGIELELFLLYFCSIIGVVLISVDDYRKRKRFLNRLIDKNN